MRDPEAVHQNTCGLCAAVGINRPLAGQVYKLLSLHFSIPIAERLSRYHDLIRVEPKGLQTWLEHATIDNNHINHIPPDIEHGIMVTLPHGLGMPLIDGNHRAARALRNGTDFFAAVLSEKETRRLLRLTMGRMAANRSWKLLTVSGQRTKQQ